jgi:L-amino acid N-acyltransferase YncA
MLIRPAVASDANAIWGILEPIILAGETYPLPMDMSREEALAYWLSRDNEVFVAEDNGEIVGTYYQRQNQKGGGAHVANCGYMTAPWASGRGAARAMCSHSLDHAKINKFRAMQFNFVVSTNARAIRLWEHFGFVVLCRLPAAFLHPARGFVDAFVMHRHLFDTA